MVDVLSVFNVITTGYDFGDVNANRTSQDLASVAVMLALVENCGVRSRGITFNRIRPVDCLNMRTGQGGG